MLTLEKFQASYVEFLSAFKTQLLVQGSESCSRNDRRTIADKLLSPYRELLPHDMLLLESILNCEGLTDTEAILSQAAALCQARGQ